MSEQATSPAADAVTDPAAAAPTDAPGRRTGAGVLALFTAAVFASAFLLFLVEPMYTRMVLPLLGGTPAVWNTCILFFQATLLAGYLYAHGSARWLAPRAQAAAHLALLALALALLPIGVGGAAPEGTTPPVPWLLLLMATTVGLPFFALAGTGPLLQRWFSYSGHRDAGNPYFLYAASNLGSMVALLGYPLLVEPALRLGAQSRAWTAGYLLLALLVAACVTAPWRAARGAAEDATDAVPQQELAPSARRRVEWVLLALLPSALMLSVTTFLTTDIAPVPLLWVVPLALYLLTFTLAFARRPPLPHRWVLALLPFVVALLVLGLLFDYARTRLWTIPLHLGTFFVVALACHGELVRRRPGVSHLTEFYLWIAVGGLVGGVFNVLVAPALFPRMEEYALLVAAAGLARPWRRGTTRPPSAGEAALLLPFGAGLALLVWPDLLLAALVKLRPELQLLSDVLARGAAAVLLATSLLGMKRRPVLFTACVTAAVLARMASEYGSRDFLLVERSFFGRYAVVELPGQPNIHRLLHGSTLHGAQDLSVSRRREPLTYYGWSGPLGQMFAGIPHRPGSRRVAVVGLGTGTMAAYGTAGERWTFFEIDPGMERIARDRRLFTYLSDSPAQVDVVLGDARLSLRRAARGTFDVMVLDAFSSDAIPVHLMTLEALDTYLDKLAPGGVLAFHLSNRFLDLEPVVAALARERGLVARIAASHGSARPGLSSSTWAVLARREADLGGLATDRSWQPLRLRRDVGAWTDDHSSILRVIRR